MTKSYEFIIWNPKPSVQDQIKRTSKAESFRDNDVTIVYRYIIVVKPIY